MKRLSLIAATLISTLLLMSCKNNNQKAEDPVQYVSETSIKTEVLGLTLCETSKASTIEKSISDAIDKLVYSDSQKDGAGTKVRVIPLSLEVPYGGLSWHYVDVTLNEDKKIVSIVLNASYESLERAKKQFEDASKIFTQKYGNGNYEGERHVFWTDLTNTAGLLYEASSALDGSDRSFCYLYSMNIELTETLANATTPDV